MGLYEVVLVLSGILIGTIIASFINKYSDKIKKNKVIEDINSQYKQILKNLTQGKTIFKNRVNNTVFIGSNLEDYGDVDVVYMMDNRDVAIFKENKCIYNSQSAKKEIVDDITLTIEKKFQKEINDVVEILGFKFYKKEFEKAFGISVDELQKQMKNNPLLEGSEIDKIKKENESLFDINEILDKISEKGIGSLTFEERIFLDQYSNRDNEDKER